MKVYVISKHGKPLMPTTPARARKMLRDGKAKCRNIFKHKGRCNSSATLKG